MDEQLAEAIDRLADRAAEQLGAAIVDDEFMENLASSLVGIIDGLEVTKDGDLYFGKGD